jgi:hypothetical protein
MPTTEPHSINFEGTPSPEPIIEADLEQVRILNPKSGVDFRAPLRAWPVWAQEDAQRIANFRRWVREQALKASGVLEKPNKDDMEVDLAELSKLPYATRERLRLLDIIVDVHRSVGREIITEFFGASTATVTRDLELYRQLAPNNLHYMESSRTYIKRSSFVRLFK